MAGMRAAEQIRLRDPHRMLSLTILGDEVHEAYNRVLLSDVLAGRHLLDDIRLGAPGWQKEQRVEVYLGDPVVAIDRVERTVRTAAGRDVCYDVLIFATGSRPIVPNVGGLCRGDGTLLPGAFFLRTMDDCRELRAAATSAHRVAVLGGGLLGVEAARALAVRGTEVVVLHAATHVLDRQLDAPAGAVLGRALRDLGIGLRLNADVTQVVVDDAGRLGGLELDDGSCVLADLVVVATGTTPRTELARACGLSVDAGIVTDDTMRSVTDPRVFAIGDCAQHGGKTYGLVAAAWEHARIAADHITGADPASRYTGSRSIARLKADGITVASMGATEATEPNDEVVMVTDTAKGSYRKLVVRDGRLQGAVVVGALAGIGMICQLFERDVLLPSDRLSLLAQPAHDAQLTTAVGSPALMPSGTTVCHCNGVTKKAIQQAVLGGSRTVAAVAQATRATSGCGGCRDVVGGLVDWIVAADAEEGASHSTADLATRRATRTPVEVS
jgi:NAD(P)H-nitrite reductase large subunit